MSANLFQTISNSSLRKLAERGQIRQYRKNSLLIEEGDQGNTLYIVLKGRLKAYSRSSGKVDRELIYGFYGPGDLVGEMSLDDGPRSASVMALDATSCSIVTKQTLKAFISEEPEFAFDLLARIIARARRATQRARSLALMDAYGRLVELITNNSELLTTGERAYRGRTSHRELAAQVGCSREMVSRLMKDLFLGDYLAYDQEKCMVIKKPLPPNW